MRQFLVCCGAMVHELERGKGPSMERSKSPSMERSKSPSVERSKSPSMERSKSQRSKSPSVDCALSISLSLYIYIFLFISLSCSFSLFLSSVCSMFVAQSSVSCLDSHSPFCSHDISAGQPQVSELLAKTYVEGKDGINISERNRES